MPADPAAAIRRRLAGFVATLRDQGYSIGVAETRDALTVLTTCDTAATARPALRALLCGRRGEWDGFDPLFDAFWSGARVRSRVAVQGTAQTSQRTLKTLGTGGSGTPGPATDTERGTDGPDAAPHGMREGASRADSLAHTDFRHLTDPQALAEAHALAARLARSMQARLTRRARPHRRGARIDLRRTLTAARATGGTPIRLIHRRPRTRQLRLVILLDASGSMSLYTGVFLRFVHGLLDSFAEAEAFLFHTRLVHVSAALADRDAARALDRLGLMATGVGGGTKIGEALASFNTWHAPRVIHSRTCVMILSDGYDTGAPEQMGAEMARLARRCRRIVWLNPLLGWQDYAPVARGMAAALPHVDLFAPAHNLASLAALEPYLARL